MEIEEAEKWWPNGLGEQKLYNVELKLKKDHQVITEVSKKIGLREIEIVREADSIGHSFSFEVNGHPVFMKGANYIPQDIFLDRVNEEDYERLILDAVEANYNMIRIWGGGIYEKDIFYDLCDQYGILVWQDFMFACAMYPGNDEFLENVRKEAVYQVKRLRDHACIALWCGDNEILSGWNRWGWKESVLKEQGQEAVDNVWQAYDTLFHSILPDVVQKHDPEKLYWSSSPSADIGELEDWLSGDVHYWGVWWGKEAFSNYAEKIGRFMSEYGFQSFPDLNTVNKYALEADHDIFSEVMKSHQRSSIGNGTIEEYMKRDYKDPKDFSMFLYVNHLLQAEGIKVAMEAHRRNMPYCMGSLYWQLNDVWPVASWAGIDYYGNWKALHYFVKKAFATFLVSPVISKNDELEVYVVSDELKDTKGKLALRLIDFEGKIHWEEEKAIEIKANSSSLLYSGPISKFLEKGQAKDLILETKLKDSDDKLLSQNLLYFLPPKELELPNPELTFEIVELDGLIEVKVTTKKLAKNVYLFLEGAEGRFSDNYFDLLPGETKSVSYLPRENGEMDLASFKMKLKLFTLKDSY